MSLSGDAILERDALGPSPQVIAIAAEDNVGVVVVERIVAGARAQGAILETGGRFTVALIADLPFGHKVALAALAPGDPIIKQGWSIGNALTEIRVGAHVHTHNLESNWR